MNELLGTLPPKPTLLEVKVNSCPRPLTGWPNVPMALPVLARQGQVTRGDTGVGGRAQASSCRAVQESSLWEAWGEGAGAGTGL